MNILITTLNSKFIHTALSIRYLKSYCKDEFPNIEIEEYTINQNTDYITGEIFKKNPDIVAFSSYIWNIEQILEISERLKLINKDITIILGGPEVSYNSEEILKENPFIDFIIYGEGEETFKELLLNIKNKKDFRNVQGIVHREDENIYVNPPRDLIQNLDSIPSPFDDDIEAFKNRIVYFESSRGCPFNCQFCLSSTIKGVRFFSIERVKSDLKKLIDLGVKQVKFVDRTFNAKKGYAMEIMRFIISQNVKDINFHFEVTAHLIEDDMLEFLRTVDEGLFQFEVGVQSTNPMTLEAIDRQTDFNKLSKVVDQINSYNNIHLHLDLIAGLPHENYNSFKKSFNDVYGLRPHKLQLGFLKLLKGSELRKRKDDYGFKFINKPSYEVMETKDISYRELLKLKQIEDLVEKYGNEGYFKNSIEYIIENFFESPFDFYSEFADFWETKKYNEASHNRLSLYKKLYEFSEGFVKGDIELIREFIKFDLILNTKSPNIPEYLNNEKKENLKTMRHDFLQNDKNLKAYLPRYADTPVKRILNDVHFEGFNYDIKYIIENKYKKESIKYVNRIYLFVYNLENKVFDKCEVFDITKRYLKERGA
ncbi:cobalamin B12-binding/radical SAM domain-containing protein [Gottschalkia acidurici 9a]|uniref:Cobalamin B12-binding/radical SAM domain-containing protein n=1 Tax=Gottschalkia acidurici (strain ATCC 7906 / DSM 604 / BCRC 14475 / CIP 104303 / KCTC 5404 / NCIMB 10678 / 9a) TaxID=1128398 RepID=K0AZ31_GOTA9|nr:B12-binding domain-containing radical SAM protein [Gottschalkia acidurici]AFS77945.1 cobalamin B12-binding/radical SAM domain-containing protein [Gottschalkia acidurici 9a]